MTIDISRFIETFCIEAGEHVSYLNKAIISLEKDPESQDFNEMYRVAHTLKGAARMMGLRNIQALSHKIEDVMDVIREKDVQLNTKQIDVLLKALDLISVCVEKARLGQEKTVDVEEAVVLIDEMFADKSEFKEDVQEETQEVSDKNQEDNSSNQSTATEIEPIFTETETYRSDQIENQSAEQEKYVHIPLSRVDELLNLMGELVINRVNVDYKLGLHKSLFRRLQSTNKMVSELESLIKDELNISDEVIVSNGNLVKGSKDSKGIHLLSKLHDVSTQLTGIKDEFHTYAEESQVEATHLNPITNDLQSKMKELRMLPCATLFEGMPRMVRDLSKELGKDIELVLKGESTQLDKKVLDAIKSPLIHLVRNAIDHGIESPECRGEKPKKATLEIAAFQEGDKIIIEVKDDGRGIDTDLILEHAVNKGLIDIESFSSMSKEQIFHLLFMPGFSTSKMITDVSGRGVGLDVVKTEIEELKGFVHVDSELGSGTLFRLELPLSIAIMSTLLLKSGGEVWAMPIANLRETLTVAKDEFSILNRQMILNRHGRNIPVFSLSQVLEQESQSLYQSNKVVVVKSHGRDIAFIVDQILGEEEIFVKGIEGYLEGLHCVSGATVLANGKIVLVLDPNQIVDEATNINTKFKGSKKKIKKQKRVLVVEDSLTSRELQKAILERNGFLVEVAIDGINALEKIEMHVFDVIVSDIKMPRMDGYELCEKIKEHEKYKDIPFIFVTSLSKDSEKRKGMELGAQAYIKKSEFDQKRLVETIHHLV
jgi:two-component system, chemotaxis family, sensor kinase CheA